MNGKQFGILLALVVVLGGGGLLIYNKRGDSWSGGNSPAAGQKLLGEFQVNDVAHIVIKHDAGELDLAKKDDLWRVRERADYPADFGEISKLLLKLHDLKVVQTDQIGASQLGRLGLAAPGPGSNTAMLVELRDTGGKIVKSLLLGKKHMQKSNRPSPYGDMGDEGWPDGRYVMTDAASGSYALISDALTEVEAKPENWLSKDFIKVEKPRTISVTFAEATNSWQLTRTSETAEWVLTDAKSEEKLDSNKASAVASPFSSPSISDVAIGLTPEQTGLDRPTTIKVSTFDGFDYTVNVGAKTNDSFHLTVTVSAGFPKGRTPGPDEKPEDKTKLDKEFADNLKKLEEKFASEKAFSKWTYLIPGWTVDSLLKKRSEMLEEKKAEAGHEAAPGEAPPAAITLPNQ